MAYKMPFGKYRGRELSSLPRDYLEWLNEDERELREPLKTNVARLLSGDYDLVEEERPTKSLRGSWQSGGGTPAPVAKPPISGPAVIKADLGAGVEAVGTEGMVTAQALASISRALWALHSEIRGIRHEAGEPATDAPVAEGGNT